MSQKQDDSIDVVVRPSRTLTIAGETFTITPFRLKQLRQILDSIEVMQSRGAEISAANVVELAKSNIDEMISLGTILLGKPAEWFEDLGYDELVEIGTNIIEINARFFEERVLPLVLASPAVMRALGHMLSLASSMPGTDGMTSLTTPSMKSSTTSSTPTPSTESAPSESPSP